MQPLNAKPEEQIIPPAIEAGAGAAVIAAHPSLEERLALSPSQEVEQKLENADFNKAKIAGVAGGILIGIGASLAFSPLGWGLMLVGFVIATAAAVYTRTHGGDAKDTAVVVGLMLTGVILGFALQMMAVSALVGAAKGYFTAAFTVSSMMTGAGAVGSLYEGCLAHLRGPSKKKSENDDDTSLDGANASSKARRLAVSSRDEASEQEVKLSRWARICNWFFPSAKSTESSEPKDNKLLVSDAPSLNSASASESASASDSASASA